MCQVGGRLPTCPPFSEVGLLKLSSSWVKRIVQCKQLACKLNQQTYIAIASRYHSVPACIRACLLVLPMHSRFTVLLRESLSNSGVPMRTL